MEVVGNIFVHFMEASTAKPVNSELLKALDRIGSYARPVRPHSVVMICVVNTIAILNRRSDAGFACT